MGPFCISCTVQFSDQHATNTSTYFLPACKITLFSCFTVNRQIRVEHIRIWRYRGKTKKLSALKINNYLVNVNLSYLIKFHWQKPQAQCKTGHSKNNSFQEPIQSFEQAWWDLKEHRSGPEVEKPTSSFQQKKYKTAPWLIYGPTQRRL